MNIELRHIQYFNAVAREMSFRKASQRLNMAQPALSRAIQQLEGRLDAQLFHRTSRRVVLTNAGKVFMEGCHAIIDQVESLEQRVKQAASGQLGALTIGYSDFAISGELPMLVKEFQARHSGISLQLVHHFSEHQLIKLRQREIDFGFLTSPISEPEFGHIQIQKDSYVVVLPENHPLAEESMVDLGALAEEPFILGNDDYWTRYNVQLQQLCKNAGFVPHVKQEAVNCDGILGLVSAHMGLTIFPSCISNYHRQGVVIRPITDQSAALITSVTWHKEAMSPTHACFLEFVREYQERRANQVEPKIVPLPRGVS